MLLTSTDIDVADRVGRYFGEQPPLDYVHILVRTGPHTDPEDAEDEDDSAYGSSESDSDEEDNDEDMEEDKGRGPDQLTMVTLQ